MAGRRCVMKPMNVNGAILTGKAIEQLKDLQEDENSMLEYYLKNLHNAVKWILNESKEFRTEPGKAEKAMNLIGVLYAICDIFEYLYAVENESD
jgi:hypothetical protein